MEGTSKQGTSLASEVLSWTYPGRAKPELSLRISLVVITSALSILPSPLYVPLSFSMYGSATFSLLVMAILVVTGSLIFVLRATASLELCGWMFLGGQVVPLGLFALFCAPLRETVLAFSTQGLIISSLIGGGRVAVGGTLALSALVGMQPVAHVLGWANAIEAHVPMDGSHEVYNYLILILSLGFLAFMLIREHRRSGLVVEDLEHTLEGKEAAAEEDKRLASIGRLASGVAHEVNNPLTYVVANLELASESVESQAPVDEELALSITEAQDGARRVAAIVQDLHALARLAPTELSSVALSDSLRAALRMVRGQSPEVKLQVEEAIKPQVYADEGKLTQVLVNLLRNAIQAAPRGRVVLRTKAEASGTVSVEVADDGAGLPPPLLENLSQPFFTTKGDRGMGLGLAVSCELMQSMGGSLEAAPNLPRGTIMRLRLREAPFVESPSPSPPPSLPTRAILIIDDDERVSGALEKLLRGHQVRVEASIEAAVEALASQPRVDLILCDLMMGDRPGWEFAATVERRFPELSSSLVFMTGGAMDEAAVRFVEDSGHRVVFKPLDGPQLRALLAENLGPAPEA